MPNVAGLGEAVDEEKRGEGGCALQPVDDDWRVGLGLG